MKEGATAGQVQDRHKGLKRHQDDARSRGSGDSTVQSDKKTQDNWDNRNRRIKNSRDARDEYE